MFERGSGVGENVLIMGGSKVDEGGFWFARSIEGDVVLGGRRAKGGIERGEARATVVECIIRRDLHGLKQMTIVIRYPSVL